LRTARHRRIGTAAVLISLGLVAGLPSAAEATTRPGTVTVHLGYHNQPFTDEDELLDVGSACAGLTVGLYSTDGLKLMTATTNAAGTAAFAKVTDDTSYRVRFDSSGCTNVPGLPTLVGFSEDAGTGDYSYYPYASDPLDTTILVGAADSDHDGLDDYYETNVSKTSPTSADTDGDKRTDYNELGGDYYWSNPLLQDTDGDHYSDYVEVTPDAFACGDYPSSYSGADPNDDLEHPTLDVPSWGHRAKPARVDKTARVVGVQPCTGVSVRYQWTVRGKAVKGATGTRFKVTKKHRGKAVALRVTMSYPGFPSVSGKVGFGRAR
jgi:hypothetical protein